MTRYTVGVIGLGRIGQMRAEILRAHPLVEGIVLAGREPSTLQVLADEYDAVTATIDAVFAPGNPLGLDAVLICTPTSAHEDLLVRAARAQLPAFCEKPLAVDVAEARRATEAIEAVDLPHLIGFQRRFDAGYQRAKAALDAGELGELRRFHAISADYVPPTAEYLPTSGGIFLDCNSHDFDVLRWLTGREVVEVFATGAARGDAMFARHNDLSDAVAILRLDDGCVGTVQASRHNGQGHEVRLDLMGTAGTLNVGLDERVPMRSAEAGVTFPSGRPWVDFIERFQPSFGRQMDHFLRVTLAGGPSGCTARDALEALRIGLACKLSSVQQRVVRVTDVG